MQNTIQRLKLATFYCHIFNSNTKLLKHLLTANQTKYLSNVAFFYSKVCALHS